MSKEKLDINKDMMYKKIMPSSLQKNEDSLETVKPKINLDNEKLIVNIIEVLVKEKLSAVLSRFNCCRCDRCRDDIIALTLNSIQAKYVVCDRSAIQDIVGKIDPISVNAALIRSIIKVRNNPRH